MSPNILLLLFNNSDNNQQIATQTKHWGDDDSARGKYVGIERLIRTA